MNRDFNLTIREIELHGGFTIYDTNLDGAAPWPMRTRMHCFRHADGPDAHDHPMDLEVYIPRDGGGYVEQIFTKYRDGWKSRKVTRLPGTAFFIPARRVHRIDRLLAPVVWTHVITGQGDGHWRVYPEAEVRNGRVGR